MRMVDIILKKRNGNALSKEEIDFFVSNYTKGNIPDYQVSALLMAIYFRSMNEEETFYLTEAMLNSGDILDLSSIEGVKVDKHSTGGVGDKVSLIVGPIVASCGLKLAKMSGRGLGHTGGTLDKLESIPGMKVKLSERAFIKQVNQIGMAIISQSENLDPADKKLYALRDVTGTVDSYPLIASSIMSKKLASGADTILLDVKYGNGAFMKTIDDACELARIMVKIGDYFNKDTRAEITSMEEPLGKAIGNILEVKEAVETLKGNGPSDLVELCLSSCATIFEQAKLVSTHKAGIELAKRQIENLEAYEEFKRFVKAQGGDIDYIEDLEKFPVARYQKDLLSTKKGYVTALDALKVGTAAMKLGAGREKYDDKIDYTAGIYLNKKVGDKVEVGEPICTIFTEKPGYDEIAIELMDAYKIGDKRPSKHPMVERLIK